MGAVGQALGVSGEQKEYYQNESKNLPLEQLRARQDLYKTGHIPNELASYAISPEMTAAQAISNLDQPYLSPAQRDAARNLLATGALTGSKFATEQVMGSPVLGQLFGKGGALERAGSEEQQLASRGFSLQPEDYEAYGQASGNIARMFGSQEQGLAQALASRGLAAAPSGAAGVEYTGMMGSKQEQLQNAQRQIAEQRMAMNLGRLKATRDYLTNLGGQAQSAIQQQYGRQLAGAGEQRQALENAAQLTTAQNAEANAAGLASMQNKQSQKGMTLGEAFGAGLKQTAYGAGTGGVDQLQRISSGTSSYPGQAQGAQGGNMFNYGSYGEAKQAGAAGGANKLSLFAGAGG